MQPPPEMQSEPPDESSESTTTRLASWAYAVAYLLLAAAVGVFVRPLDRWWLLGIALVPGVVAVLCGLPKVVRSRPRGLMALFHLVVYPLAAVITTGLPGAFIAYLVAKLIDN